MINISINYFLNAISFACAGRVRLLLSKGHSCYRPRRDGERKRKSVRGCIVDSNLSVLALVIIRKGKQVNDRLRYIVADIQTLEVHAVQGVFEIFNFLEIQSYAWEIKFVF